MTQSIGSVYGFTDYGTPYVYGTVKSTSTYPGSGVTLPVVDTQYILTSLQSIPLDYSNVQISWDNIDPVTTQNLQDFRLLSNPWGFPVDENDGTVLYEATGNPVTAGTRFTDDTANTGKINYYGVYVQDTTGTWLRAGFTACLLPKYYGYDVKLLNDLPAFFQSEASSLLPVERRVDPPNLPVSGQSVTNIYDSVVNIWFSAPVSVAINGIPQGTSTFFIASKGDEITVSYTGDIVWDWVLPADGVNASSLHEYLAVLGYGLDLLKTQYDMEFNGLNDPMSMTLGELIAFAGEIGMPYNSELPAYVMRKAAAYWAQVMKERGTLAGIAEHITLLTGYSADVQTSRNMLLNNDQSVPENPQIQPWSSGAKYVVGDLVTYPVPQKWSVVSSYNVGDVVIYNEILYTATAPEQGVPPTSAGWSSGVTGPYTYYCIKAVTTLPGPAPSGTLSEDSTSTWVVVYGSAQQGSAFAQNNSQGFPGGAGLWEYMESGGTRLADNIGVGFPTPTQWVQSSTTSTVGSNGTHHTIRASNNSGATQTNTMLRSLSRTSADITAGRTYPDPQVVVETGIPVPAGILPWSPSTRYATNTIVSYNNLNYVALRESTGATPPTPGLVLNQNYSFESGTTGWTAVNGTLAASTAETYSGTHSGLLTPNGTSTTAYFKSASVPVTPGATYSISGLVYASSAVSSGVISVGVNWYDPFGAYLSTTSMTGPAISAVTWTHLSNTVTAPGNATAMQLTPVVGGTPASSLLTYWDLVTVSCTASPEWQPLGRDTRIPITQSAYTVADLGLNPTVSTTVTPFVEWYDNWGNIITRVLARGSSSGSYPTNYQYDAFDTAPGAPLAGRYASNQSSVWSVPAGSWVVSTFGTVYAGTTTANCLGVLPSPAQGFTAATVVTAAVTGYDCGPVFWLNDASDFWMAGLHGLYSVSSGSVTQHAYTASPNVGDRIVVAFNNTTSTVTYPSGTITGPSIVVWKNSVSTANKLVAFGSGGTMTQTAMPTSGVYLPATTATTSNAGIGSIVQ